MKQFVNNVMNKYWFYDVEILPSLFSVVFINEGKDKMEVFELSPYENNMDDMIEFLKKLKENNCILIGYNNLSFDYPILHTYLILHLKNLRGRKIVKILFNKAQEIIKTNKKKQFFIKHPEIKQIDLMIINSFDNVARSVSLDALKFVFHNNDISQLNKSYLGRDKLTKEEIKEIIDYCIDDVLTTIELWEKSIKVRYVRDNLSEKFFHMYNLNDINLGGEQLLHEYCERTDQNPEDIRYINTEYDQINMKDIIYDYLYDYFYIEPFASFIDWLRKQQVNANQLDGAFTKLPDHIVEPIKDHIHIERTKGLIKKLTLIYKNYKFTYGMGGLHSVNKAQVWKEDEDYFLITSDAASFHPSNIVVNELYQKHLGPEFNFLYADKLHIRLQEKTKSKEEQEIAIIEGYKLMLNGVFGKTLGDYGWLSDKVMGLRITINNQLMITLLAIFHVENIPGIELIDANTDGIYYKVPRKYEKEYFQWCDKWEEITKIKLEHDKISKIAMRDGNNYIAKLENGYIKKKGVFVDEPQFYQNHSNLIVPKALKAYYIDNIPVEDFIKNHDNIYDFMALAKASKGSILQLQEVEYCPKISKKTGKELKTLNRVVHKRFNQEKLVRFYVSNTGLELIKILPPLEKHRGTPDFKHRENAFEGTKGFLVKVCNQITEEDIFDINFDYYIKECKKIINLIEYENT